MGIGDPSGEPEKFVEIMFVGCPVLERAEGHPAVEGTEDLVPLRCVLLSRRATLAPWRRALHCQGAKPIRGYENGKVGDLAYCRGQRRVDIYNPGVAARRFMGRTIP